MRYPLRRLLLWTTIAAPVLAFVGYWYREEGLPFAAAAGFVLLAAVYVAGGMSAALAPQRGPTVSRRALHTCCGALFGCGAGFFVDMVVRLGRMEDLRPDPPALWIVCSVAGGLSALLALSSRRRILWRDETP